MLYTIKVLLNTITMESLISTKICECGERLEYLYNGGFFNCSKCELPYDGQGMICDYPEEVFNKMKKMYKDLSFWKDRRDEAEKQITRIMNLTN